MCERGNYGREPFIHTAEKLLKQQKNKLTLHETGREYTLIVDCRNDSTEETSHTALPFGVRLCVRFIFLPIEFLGIS